jgi:hypothetical protein
MGCEDENSVGRLRDGLQRQAFVLRLMNLRDP